MKKLSLLATLLNLASCSVLIPEYGHYYVADTAKRYKCDPQVLDKSIIQEMFKQDHYTEASMKKWESTSGYSGCKGETNGVDTSKYDCKHPVPFTQFITSKQALCHKFMVDNKLMENTTK
jgi:hypothetical protein